MNFLYRVLKLDTISNRMIFYIIIFILVSHSLLTIFLMILDQKQRIKDTKGLLQQSLRQQSLVLENWANQQLDQIHDLANLTAIKQSNLDAAWSTLHPVTTSREDMTAIIMLDQHGSILIDTSQERVHQEEVPHSGQTLRDHAFFQAALRGEDFIGEAVFPHLKHESVFIFSTPVFSSNGSFQGALLAMIDLKNTNEWLHQIVYGESGRLLLLNRDGHVLAQTNQTKTNERISANAEKQIIRVEQSLLDGRYILRHEISRKEMLEPHIQNVQIVFVMLAITMIMIFLVPFVLKPVSRYIHTAFTSLIHAFHAVKKGNYQKRFDLNTFENAPSEIRQLMELFNDMSAKIHEHEEHLQKLSSTDALTGVANRRMLEEYFQREWDYARRESKPVSVLFIDIDSFKLYNDIFGHQTGDQCLIQVAKSIQHAVKRARDFVARYGGEEFVVILPETDLESASIVAKRIRKQVEDLQIQHSTHEPTEFVTVSIGISSAIPTQSMDKDDLIQFADEALYKAKSSGKNQVVVREIVN